MKNFRTSLVREKFAITDLESEGAEPIIALSNRIVVPLLSDDGNVAENFIVRTQNMHSCTRMAAAIVKEFFDRGSIAKRKDFDWAYIWKEVTKGYEKEFNPDIWGTVYHKGREVFKSGNHHPFLDIIEKCDASNDGNYSQSVVFAETAFKQAGKTVQIDYDSNVALIIAIDEEKAKCGVIIRSATGATTFNFNASQQNNTRPLQTQTNLTVAASYLEGVQLAFQVGFLKKKHELGLVETGSEEFKKYKKSEDRLANLNRALSSFDYGYNVHYRPDRPQFNEMVKKAEEFAMKLLEPQIKEMLETGDLDEDDWIV